jgi:hypothetical protein
MKPPLINFVLKLGTPPIRPTPLPHSQHRHGFVDPKAQAHIPFGICTPQESAVMANIDAEKDNK